MIELKDVSKVYPNGTVALEKVNLKFNKGEFVILMGESGAGKTTLLKVIRGDEQPTSGEVLIEDKKIESFDKTHLRRKIGFAFQDFPLLMTELFLITCLYLCNSRVFRLKKFAREQKISFLL